MKSVATTGVLAAAVLLQSCSTGAGSVSPMPPAPAIASPQQTALRPQTTGNFAGFVDADAYAEYTTVEASGSTQFVSGPLAKAALGCVAANGSNSNSVLTLNAAPYAVSSGTADDTVSTTRTATAATVTSTSTIQGVSILGGVIKATVVKAQANSNASAGSATSNESGSQLAGLEVAGTPVSALPAPNTRVALPGLGYVVLNEVIGPANGVKSSNGAILTHVYVNMIHVYVDTANTLGIKAGTEIVVGSAYSSFTIPPAPFQVNPSAYSLYAVGVNGNAHATSGPWSMASVGCNALSDTNRLAQASTPVGNLGTMVDTANAAEQQTSTSAAASSSTGSVDVLNGLVAGQSLVSNASVKRSGSTFSRSAGFTFASLSVAGQSISPSVPPNTRVNLAGLGYAIVNAQSGTTSTGSAAEEVNGVLIYVTSNNSYNLPVGAQITIAHAHASIGGF